MYLRFICDWPPHYKDGQAIEIPDRIGADFVARAMAQVVTAADVNAYSQTMATIDRAIDKRITVGASRMPARGGRRVISEDQWRRELGQDRSGYQQARLAYIAGRINVSGRLPAAITVRS
jgi:hypothetical protein